MMGHIHDLVCQNGMVQLIRLYTGLPRYACMKKSDQSHKPHQEYITEGRANTDPWAQQRWGQVPITPC